MLAKDMFRLAITLLVLLCSPSSTFCRPRIKGPGCYPILPPYLRVNLENKDENKGNINKSYVIDEQSKDENEDRAQRYSTSVKLPENCGRVPLSESRLSLSPYDSPRFVAGGFEAERGQFPAYVFLRFQTELFTYNRCGGTLITNRHVLTAAHCAKDRRVALVMPTASFDDTLRDDSDKSYVTEKICVSPDYKANHQNRINEFDYAVLKLKDSIEFNEYVQPACLPDEDLSPETQAYAVGLGIILKKDGRTRYPKKLQVLPVKRDDCNENDQHISNICFRSNDKAFIGDTCAGDSGGPVFTVNKNRLTLNGITSYGPNECEQGVIGTSVNVHAYNMRDNIISLLEECA